MYVARQPHRVIAPAAVTFTMNILKRFEVWLLLFLSLAAAAWVLFSDSGPDAGGNPEPLAESAPPALKLYRCTLERDYGNARLDVEVRYHNSSPRPLLLQPPDVRLLTSAGAEVPPFVLATEKIPQIPARTAQDVRLRYWLDRQHLAGGLTLDIRGEKAEVKPPGPLELDALPNGKARTWEGSIR